MFETTDPPLRWVSNPTLERMRQDEREEAVKKMMADNSHLSAAMAERLMDTWDRAVRNAVQRHFESPSSDFNGGLSELLKD